LTNFARKQGRPVPLQVKAAKAATASMPMPSSTSSFAGYFIGIAHFDLLVVSSGPANTTIGDTFSRPQYALSSPIFFKNSLYMKNSVKFSFSAGATSILGSKVFHVVLCSSTGTSRHINTSSSTPKSESVSSKCRPRHSDFQGSFSLIIVEDAHTSTGEAKVQG
jgi:hypothetical protein